MVVSLFLQREREVALNVNEKEKEGEREKERTEFVIKVKMVLCVWGKKKERKWVYIEKDIKMAQLK